MQSGPNGDRSLTTSVRAVHRMAAVEALDNDKTSDRTMDLKLTPGRLYGAAIIALSIWFLHGFLHGVLAASVAAIASWPLYKWFAARMRQHVGRHVTALMFTAIITVFVLAPMAFALWALLSESHALSGDCGRRRKGHRLAGLAARLAVARTLAKRPLVSRSLARLDPAGQRDGISGPGAIARAVRGLAPADPRLHDPAVVLPVRARRIAGA